ncbi:heme peroxidase family protein [Agromyces sp. MMS24-JH15]|uniref:peroxidase family protein n=1 Tax=Agromyces sp. MMS24-JH15 TaxID=3243765 RepID=UPI00374A9163
MTTITPAEHAAGPDEQPIPQKSADFPRVIRGLSHGGHAVTEQDEPSPRPDTNVLANVVDVPDPLHVKEISTPFGYMFEALSADYPFAHLNFEPPSTIVAALKALGNAMVETPPPAADGDSTIAPVYTYWGQFVDHDLTANTDRENAIGITEGILDPLSPSTVMRDLRNLREPQLNLDSLYGRGPVGTDLDDVPYVGDAFAVVTEDLPPGPGGSIDPQTDLPRHQGDTARPRGSARIGDGRNDENLIVAQLHGSILRFHNAILEWLDDPAHDVALAADDVPPDGYSERFWKARRLVQWTYQWVTVHDFLKTIAKPEIVDGILDGSITPVFAPTGEADTFMPLEFSVAAFRFGHSMVRGGYDWNENFGSAQPGLAAPAGAARFASFGQLFQFTGNGGGPVNAAGQLPRNWPARFERLTGHEAGAGRFARKIDTVLAAPLADMRNQGNDDHFSERIKRILKRLAVRNLIRGYRLSLPTGQAVAAALGIPPLTRNQLLDGSDDPAAQADLLHDTLIDGNFVDRTPLWFYVLREAEVLEGGNRLGPVGSRIVAETIIGQLRADPRSFLNTGWVPADGVHYTTSGGGDAAVADIKGLLHVAGVHAAPAA